MALSGLHVVCGTIGVVNGASLMVNASWSQTMAAAGTTSKAAARDGSIMQVTASADSYFAVGAVPDASQTSGDGQAARYFISANTTREVLCKAGDKLAWVAA